MRPIRTAARALIILEGKLLAIKMRDQSGVFYILPGGGQNHGETLRQGLQRECLEEIGTDVDIGESRISPRAPQLPSARKRLSVLTAQPRRHWPWHRARQETNRRRVVATGRTAEPPLPAKRHHPVFYRERL